MLYIYKFYVTDEVQREGAAQITVTGGSQTELFRDKTFQFPSAG